MYKILLDLYEKEIKEYCNANSLDIDKIRKSPKCGNDSLLYIQHVDKEKGLDGLKNEKPAEILLLIEKNGDEPLKITQYENAKVYLGKASN